MDSQWAHTMIEMVATRWYVFCFLAAFLCLAGRRWGIAQTLAWLVIGYAIALASEASSIRNGFPYGLYAYKYENLVGDPLLFGVPIWDSLAYPFLIYAGYALAQWGWPRRSWRWHALLGAFLTMLLDIVIDPVAHLGGRWFLGEIYDYASPGHYFGIPISNFCGWFLVPLAVILVNQCLVHRWHNATRAASMLDLGFYGGIAAFNIVIALTIGAWPLAGCSTLIMAATIAVARHCRINYPAQGAGNQTPASTASVRGEAPSGFAGGGGRRKPPKIDFTR